LEKQFEASTLPQHDRRQRPTVNKEKVSNRSNSNRTKLFRRRCLFRQKRHRKSNPFHSELDKGVQQILTEIEDQDYETFDTSPQGMEISRHVGRVPDNHATFGIGIKDIYSSNIETIADKLSEGPHLEDGAEIYEIIVDNIRNTSHLEEINIELHSGYTGTKVVYSNQVDDITLDASRLHLEQKYREDFSNTIRLR